LGGNHRTAVTVALIGAAATIVAAIIGVVLTRGDGGGNAPQPTFPTIDGVVPTQGQARIFLSRDSGPGGSSVRVSGRGFKPGERVVLMYHTDEVGSTAADDQGGFVDVNVTIPTTLSAFAGTQFRMVATGQESLRSAMAPFTISG
jgi:hypothetical protein